MAPDGERDELTAGCMAAAGLVLLPVVVVLGFVLARSALDGFAPETVDAVVRWTRVAAGAVTAVALPLGWRGGRQPLRVPSRSSGYGGWFAVVGAGASTVLAALSAPVRVAVITLVTLTMLFFTVAVLTTYVSRAVHLRRERREP